MVPPAGAQPGDGEDAGDIEMADDAEPAADAGAPPAVVKDPKVAKTWLQAAQKLVREGDLQARRKKPDEAKIKYENAVTAFHSSIAAGDDVGVYFELASVEEKLGRFDRAATHYRTVVQATSGVRADVQKKAAAKFDELSMEVGLVTLTVDPEGAAISLGGEVIATSPMTVPVVLMPGTYTLSFAADGFQPKDAEIKVEAGSESERAIELEPIKIVVTPPGPVDESPAAPPPVAAAPSMLPIYVGGGVAVGAASIGLITGILAVSRHGTFTGADATRNERLDARTSGENLALVTDLALGTAVVAAGFTAYWYFFKYKPGKAKFSAEAAPSTMSKVDLVPWVQSEAGGFSVAGSF